MLQLQDLSKSFDGKTAVVDAVNLELRAGVLGLIGHNGAGKTTLMQMIATLCKPSRGRILLEGEDIVARPERMRRRLGYLPQDFGVYANLTALEFLQYFAALKGVRDAGRIRRLLEQVNLHEHANRQAASFSGGMRQRLGIAQALLNEPDVLVVDEPTAGLDPEERLRFRQLLSEIGFSKLVIVSTHIVSDVENMATRLAILNRGRLSLCVSPAELLQQARGLVWAGELDEGEYEARRPHWQVLQAQRQACGSVRLRVAQAEAPFRGAQPSLPSLEEALMALRYALPHGATAGAAA
ncbi:ABC transporter ATP-binding protein [Inhella proteolytica]|uniref:ABC transporter ATP-binding protein n=1 Tax=Inhella proteolytica TaxID=2795029 RepID=A0A931J6H5_9BURK|nr:ABC transporter ATP-binding protein [Inhella proteolytica]MBH9579653.1 ABC transporter ATP-binding protein [Inhella proteolytica]